MRILYIASYQGPDIIAQRAMHRNRALGGSRKIELISRMLQKQGHEVVILSSGIPAERSGRFFPAFESTTTGEPNSGAQVLYAAGLDIRGLNYAVAILSSLQWLRRESSRQAFDLLLTYNIDEFTWLVAQFYWQWIKKIPVVLEYEDSVAVTSRGNRALRRMVWRCMERWLCSRLAGVVSVNATLADRMQNPNTYILRGVVDEELRQVALARRPALSGSPPYLALFCGSLYPGKGVHMIHEIAGQFKARVRFAITGVGPLLDELVSASQNCGGEVEVLGYLERHKLNSLLLSADILLNPHQDEPGGGILPFKLVEYLVAGGIVVTTRTGNLNDELFDYCEVTRPNGHDLAAALERVLDRRDEMVARARAAQAWAVSQYSEGAVARELDKVLSRAVIRENGL
jgi:glycosyltransferase involved in cell wall biosynthesis